jgi:hypothetical protein
MMPTIATLVSIFIYLLKIQIKKRYKKRSFFMFFTPFTSERVLCVSAVHEAAFAIWPCAMQMSSWRNHSIGKAQNKAGRARKFKAGQQPALLSCIASLLARY